MGLYYLSPVRFSIKTNRFLGLTQTLKGQRDICAFLCVTHMPSLRHYRNCRGQFRASYNEISVDDRPWEKQKSSGLSICTGTGSKAWSYNINKLVEQAVEDVLRIGKAQTGLDIQLSQDFIEKVTDEYNKSLVRRKAECSSASESQSSAEYSPAVAKEVLPTGCVCARGAGTRAWWWMAGLLLSSTMVP
uniref:Uncharacterized protein n=1 Tax=Hucho hucho TaxID=62062 RepID=A0A4W5M2T3_9TELE